jgi:acyl-CoA thioesterase FadM
MLNANKKLYHFVCAICKESNEVAALIETVEIHIDMSVRKSAEMSDAIFETLVRMQEEHKSFGAYPFETRLQIK